MKHKFILIALTLLTGAALVFAITEDQHSFRDNECGYCHVDVENAPSKIDTDITGACQTCHSEYARTMSHPTSIYPSIPIPGDLPLTEGRLTCLTCHFVHVEEGMLLRKKHNFLRRQVSGILFCSACHRINEKRHIVFENVHKGAYEETNRSTRIDRMSLECITCHDRYIVEPRASLGAGNWKHYKKEFSHPIGISYKNISSRKSRKFRPASMLNKEIKLYDGKIGCGTCHNTDFISHNSFHTDAGYDNMSAPGTTASGRAWDTSDGLYGNWNPITYRYLSPADDTLVDLTTG